MSAETIQTIRDIASIASLVLTVIVIVLSILIAALKKSKNSKIREIASKLEVATSNVITIKSVIQKFMTEAEDFINYTGGDKKSWVITKTKEYCISNSIAYDDELIESTIESLIDFSKKVNATKAKQVEVAEEATLKEKNEKKVKVVTHEPESKEKEIRING